MEKKTTTQAQPSQRLMAAWDDLIKEEDVIEKTGYSKEGLRKLRREGKIKNWTSINGRKIQYSKTELARLFNLHIAA